MTPISALYLNLFKSYGRLCVLTFSATLTLTFDLTSKTYKMTPISALYLNLYKSYGQLCVFDLFGDLDLDL